MDIFNESPSHPLAHCGVGPGIANSLRILVLRLRLGTLLLAKAGDGINRLLAYAFAGSEMVFGELGKQHSSFGLIFAFQVLPDHHLHLGILRGSLSPRIMQLIIRFFARRDAGDHEDQRRRIA